GFIECGTHLFSPSQFLFESGDAPRVGVLPRRDSEDAFEGARELGRVARRVLSGIQRAARCADQRDRGVAPGGVRRMTPLAGAESLTLGGFRNREECDL